jgi:hypothetical protein
VQARQAVAWLLESARWQYIGIDAFVGALELRAASLLALMVREPHVTVCVDGYIKSSFWVFLLLLRRLRSHPDTRAAYYGNLHKLQLVVWYADVEVNDTTLQERTHLVLLDDASYSGEQLSQFYASVRAKWPAADVTIIVPYMSGRAQALFRSSRVARVDVVPPVAIPSLFGDRTFSDILRHDVFLLWVDRPYAPEYWSYFRDVLRLRRYQNLTFFGHKLPDNLSIPELWLTVGPSIPLDFQGTTALVIKPERATELVALLKREVVADQKRDKVDAKSIKDDVEWQYSQLYSKLRWMMQNDAFRELFTLAVPLQTAAGPPKPFKRWPDAFPLVYPSACEAQFHKVIERIRRNPRKYLRDFQQDGLQRSKMLVPPTCYLAPYKTHLKL